MTLASNFPVVAPGALLETAPCHLTDLHAFGKWNWQDQQRGKNPEQQFQKARTQNKDQINPSNQTKNLKAWKVPSLWVMSASPHNSSSRRLVGREWTSPVFKSTSTAPGTPTAFLSSFLAALPASGTWGAAATQDAPSGPCPGPTPSPRRGLVDSPLATC